MSFKTNGTINYVYSSKTSKNVIVCGNFTKINNNIDAKGLAFIDEDFNFFGTEFFQMEDERNNLFVDLPNNSTAKINIVEFFDNNTKLIVAGKFNYIGNIYANNIAIYDLITQEWSHLGKLNGINNGTNNQIHAIKFFDNKIVVGGEFFNANDYPGTNFENQLDYLEDNIITAYIALYDLTGKNWYQLKGNNYHPNFIPGVNNTVYAIDVIKNTDSYDIYVGGKFTGVTANTVLGIMPNTQLFAKFNFKSLTNYMLNTWQSVLNLDNLFVQLPINYTPVIKFIDATKGYLGGQFSGNFNNTRICNALRYVNQDIFSVGQYLELTIKNQGYYSGEVRDIKFYDNTHAFICGNFNNMLNSDNIAKYDTEENIVYPLEQQTNGNQLPLNNMTWVNLGSTNNKVGRLFVANANNTTNKLIYNVDQGNNDIFESWSYSFYDILDKSLDNSIDLKKYLTEGVYNFNAFQYSEYNQSIKSYLRENYDKFKKVNNVVVPEIIDFERLDSLLSIYSDNFEGANHTKILFCLLKENNNTVNLNNYKNLFPITCYMSLINGEKVKLIINNNTYLLDYFDNQLYNKRIFYGNHSAGVNEQLVFIPTRNDTLIVMGVGSLLSNIHCLTPDTRVLTPYGYKLITELKVNDDVITSDFRRVKITNVLITRHVPDTRTYPYLIPKNSIGKNYPPSDIKVSGGHLVKFGNKWIHPEKSKLFNQIITENTIIYYHLQLENYETDNLVINDGAVVESYCDTEYFLKVQEKRLIQ